MDACALSVLCESVRCIARAMINGSITVVMYNGSRKYNVSRKYWFPTRYAIKSRNLNRV